MSGVENLIIVRGGGDLATGTIYKLHQCGFPVLVLETARRAAKSLEVPMRIREPQTCLAVPRQKIVSTFLHQRLAFHASASV